MRHLPEKAALRSQCMACTAYGWAPRLEVPVRRHQQSVAGDSRCRTAVVPGSGFTGCLLTQRLA